MFLQPTYYSKMNPISFFWFVNWLACKTDITFHDCFYLVTPNLGLCDSNQISDLASNFQYSPIHLFFVCPPCFPSYSSKAFWTQYIKVICSPNGKILINTEDGKWSYKVITPLFPLLEHPKHKVKRQNHNKSDF